MKQFYKENRVFTILMIIVAICLLIIGGVMIKYFFFGNSSSPYGDRLKNVEKYKISDSKKKDIISKLEEDAIIENVEIRVSVRTIYIKMKFTAGSSLVEAQSKALPALEQFTEKEMGYYDIEFILTSDDTDDSEGFTIMGAKNVNGTNIIWNNNNTENQEQ